MQVRLTFLGAAQNVTGSQYLVEANNTRFLVDCGLYQERELRGRNWEPFPYPPKNLDAVLLTHAHLDHSGLLPKLSREGFHSPIYCTPATAEIAEIVLMDSAKLQQEDAEFKRRRHEREGRRGPYPEIPLYTTEDAEACFPLFSPVAYEETIELGKGIEFSFHDAGHILGSSMILVNIKQGKETKTILFSGDIGGWGKPILQDPTLFKEANYVLVESTYGNRVHESEDNTVREFEEVVNATAEGGGNIVIPSFALDRAQDLMYYLNKSLLEGRMPHLPVFVDSPMAVSVTQIFKHHPELFDEEMNGLLRQKESPFDFPGLNLVTTIDQSKAINHTNGSTIIIAGSGMCTGGRIKYHLIDNITKPESTILFVGYQAEGTLGRQIVDGAKEVRILGQYFPVRAGVVQLSGFSAHADKFGLLKWLANLGRPPKRVFVTHGESHASQYFASLARGKTGWEVTVPKYRDGALLD